MKKNRTYIPIFIVLVSLQLSSAPHVAAQDTVSASPIVRIVPDSVVKSLQREKEFEYANDPEYWKKDEVQPPGNSGTGPVFPALIIIVAVIAVVCLLIFVLYKLIVNSNLIFSRSRGQKKTGSKEVQVEKDDWDIRIQTAESDDDLRLAIRYQFLKCLFLLNENGKIRLHPDATNHDYLQMLKQISNYEDFYFLNRVYEYVWYGEFVISKDRYHHFAGKFREFNKTIL